jgi:hypothetical protein
MLTQPRQDALFREDWPQRAKKRSIPYVELLSDTRTPLGGFFSILLGEWPFWSA